MSVARCPACGCPLHAASHAVAAALADGDVDAAIEAGLLDTDACPQCSDACRAALRDARDARLRALAARDRFRARNARLERRAAERAAARATPAPAATSTRPPLPPAAAAALARARARAAGRPTE